MPRWFIGELLGTYLLVLFGLGAVATAVACSAPVGLFQVAIVWGFAVTIAITLTGGMSGAHLNPAVTVAFAVYRGFPFARVTGYLLAQAIGALLAAACIYVLFEGSISAFERSSDIVRGQVGSEASAMIFGEYFPNPGAKPLTEMPRTVSHSVAAFAEFLGTALLVLSIFGLTSGGNRNLPDAFRPALIGLTLTLLICLFAPLTQAGFNPARDLIPRLFSSWVGWGKLPFTANGWGWLTVYVLAPMLGGLAGGGIGKIVFPDDCPSV